MTLVDIMANLRDSDVTAGGFIPPIMLSPPPSSVAGSTNAASILPQPRKHPLKLGSPKETAFINHIDQSLSDIQRRYAKRHTVADDDEPSVTRGYSSFKEVGRDIERLVDLVWVSGTPSLQIQYILSLAVLTSTCLESFPPNPSRLFRLLTKLDTAFASLIQGKEVDTGEDLPGFDSGKSVSPTEKVRIKSLVERTRVVVVQVMNKGEFEIHESGDGTEEQSDDNERFDVDDYRDVDMDVASVYNRTIVELGDTLTGSAIGIPDY